MPLLEVVQTRQISTSGGVKYCPVSVIRKAATVDAAEFPEREAHAGVGFAARSGGESGIHLEFTRKGPNGAAHRKKGDTPPLKGNCLDTFVSR